MMATRSFVPPSSFLIFFGAGTISDAFAAFLLSPPTSPGASEAAALFVVKILGSMYSSSRDLAAAAPLVPLLSGDDDDDEEAADEVRAGSFLSSLEDGVTTCGPPCSSTWTPGSTTELGGTARPLAAATGLAAKDMVGRACIVAC